MRYTDRLKDNVGDPVDIRKGDHEKLHAEKKATEQNDRVQRPVPVVVHLVFDLPESLVFFSRQSDHVVILLSLSGHLVAHDHPFLHQTIIVSCIPIVECPMDRDHPGDLHQTYEAYKSSRNIG